MMYILTFDIEEWFHILDNEATKHESSWYGFETRICRNIEQILKLLHKHGQSATFFCLGWMAKTHPDVLRAIDRDGHEIATHSHLHQLIYEQTPQAFRNDLVASVRAIEHCIGKKVRAFRAPGFSITRESTWAFEILAEEGIEVDCSIFPTRRAHGGFPCFGVAEPAIIQGRDFMLKELPLNVHSFLGQPFVFSGGGYFRILPYRLIRSLMHRSPYVMTYFHPRDFDPNQPRMRELSALRKFKSYYGLGSAFQKLDRLLTDFPFINLRTAADTVDWSAVKTILIA